MRFDLRATPEQHASRMSDDGCDVVFSSAPALSGRYGVDPVTMSEIGSVARDDASGLGLPSINGIPSTTFTYPNLEGVPCTFTGEQLKALYRALRDFLAGLTYYASGQLPAPPTQPVIIA